MGIGTLPSRADQDAQWKELQRLVEEAGLLEKQYLYYTCKIFFVLCLLGGGLLFLVVVDNFWVQMLTAPFLAVVFKQIGLIAHASGHRQVFVSSENNKWLSINLGFFIGLSLTWWTEKHNKHHGNPNNPSFDQDVNVPVLGFTNEQVLGKRGLYRWIVRYQHILFFPVLLLEAFSIRGDSAQYLLRADRREVRIEWFVLGLELISMCAHLIGYLFLLVISLDSWLQFLAFFLVHQGLFGLFLGSLFATNHKGREMLEGDTGRGYLWKQVPTARNVQNPPWLDWWSGGLNSQIEHHLFPGMADNKLREAREIVKPFCAKYGIPYCETGFFQTYWEILLYLHRVSAPLRAARVNASS